MQEGLSVSMFLGVKKEEEKKKLKNYHYLNIDKDLFVPQFSSLCLYLIF